MIRTQIYLPKELYQDIARIAELENKPKAEVIREVLKTNIAERKTNAADALLRIVKLGKKLKVKGPRDLSANIDKYLYEE